MKALKNIITLSALIALTLTVMAAEPEKQPAGKIHKVVFEVASDGAEPWLGALRNVENVQMSRLFLEAMASAPVFINKKQPVP